MRTQAVIETAVYVDDLRAAETFYGTVLGLRVIGKEPGRHVFFQVGEASVLLAFLAEATLKGDQFPPHGATGLGHFALGIEAEALDAWRKLLHGRGVSIEKEVEWPRGGRSLYFRDPAGNGGAGHAGGVGVAEWVVSHAELPLHDLRDAARRERPAARRLRRLPGRAAVRQGHGPAVDHPGAAAADQPALTSQLAIR